MCLNWLLGSFFRRIPNLSSGRVYWLFRIEYTVPAMPMDDHIIIFGQNLGLADPPFSEGLSATSSTTSILGNMGFNSSMMRWLLPADLVKAPTRTSPNESRPLVSSHVEFWADGFYQTSVTCSMLFSGYDMCDTCVRTSWVDMPGMEIPSNPFPPTEFPLHGTQKWTNPFGSTSISKWV